MIRESAVTLLIASVLLAGCIGSQQLSENSTLQLASSPSGAEVYLDSQYQGTTPSTISGVAPGNHTLEFRSTGYTGWKSAIAIPSGTAYYFAALTAGTVQQVSQPVSGPTTAIPVSVTVRASKEQMIVGDANVFSGIATGTESVTLTLFGPGFYTSGVVLNQVKPNAIDSWTYTWNPGTSIQSGTYTIVVADAAKTVQNRAEFSVIGNGQVTITPSSYAVSRGNIITFSGRCTTGAQKVQISLVGPERFTSGVDLGTFAVTADKTWSFRYTVDSTMPTGVYTIYAFDVPKTTSGSTQFTVGFAS
jgi:hypothetical protein